MNKVIIKGIIGTLVGFIIACVSCITVMMSVIEACDAFMPAYTAGGFIPQIITAAVPLAIVYAMFAYFYNEFLDKIEAEYYALVAE